VKTHGYDITQARLHRKTLCYSRVRGNAETLDHIVATLPQVLGCAHSSMIHGIIQQRPKFYPRILHLSIQEFDRSITHLAITGTNPDFPWVSSSCFDGFIESSKLILVMIGG
jgi:hypothetical protein